MEEGREHEVMILYKISSWRAQKFYWQNFTQHFQKVLGTLKKLVKFYSLRF